MSRIQPSVVSCPRCAHTVPAQLFSSLSADRSPAQLQAILDSEFERQRCPGCGLSFQPEHPVLLVSFDRKFWVQQLPPQQRSDYRAQEQQLLRLHRRLSAAGPARMPETTSDEVEAAPVSPARSHDLTFLRPRLVFGQHFLAECVRAQRCGLDWAALEVVKLHTYLLRLGELGRLGPAELCWEGSEANGTLRFGVYSLGSSQRLQTCVQPFDELSPRLPDAAASVARYPELYTLPYVSATRYLFGSAVEPSQESA